MPGPQIGGSKWNGYVAEGRSAIRETRKVISLLRDDIEELRTANDESNEVLNFLLGMSSRLDDISQRLDDVHSSLIHLWEIGAQFKESRIGDKR
jgi:hypothetical protein